MVNCLSYSMVYLVAAVTSVALVLLWDMVMEGVAVWNLVAAQSYMFCCCL